MHPWIHACLGLTAMETAIDTIINHTHVFISHCMICLRHVILAFQTFSTCSTPSLRRCLEDGAENGNDSMQQGALASPEFDVFFIFRMMLDNDVTSQMLDCVDYY